MSGTRSGGLKAAASNKARHGDSFYKDIGAKGGKNGRTGGFAARTVCTCDAFPWEHQKQQCAGRKGGQVSRRTPKKLQDAA